MAELLLEVFSEDIPARMQVKAADDLRRLVTAALAEAGLDHEGARAFATPRRLALSVSGLPAYQPDRREEKRGPRVGANAKAVKGFLDSLGPGMSLEDCEIREDKKGPRYIAILNRPGRPSPELIAEIVPAIIARFPWPKSMRWGAGDFRWVRPLRSILCVFDGETVPFEVAGLKSGHTTQGHRFMAPKTIGVSRLDDYEPALKAANVMLDHDERAQAIGNGARNLAFAQGLELIEDDDLIAENAGLVEWPVTLAGRFDEAFLALPPEVIVTALKAHQKCFALHDRKRSCRFGGAAALANSYILVADIEAEDGGRRIVAGNNRVIAARLADARFFFDSDRKRPLADMAKALETVRFHQKLGSMADKTNRVAALAGGIAELIDADREKAISAAKLAKADLVSGMVGEFPELQGVMGRYYALEQGIDEQICDAMAEHYRPQGVYDALPTSRIAKAVAMADKLDTLIGFWAIEETPTGSRDPYALRRAAIGIIRIIVDGGLRLHLGALIAQHQTRFAPELARDGLACDRLACDRLARNLLSFFAERLKAYLRDKGARHDLVDAVLAADRHDDPVSILRKVEALDAFLKTDDGLNLLAGVKRAGNILRIEEKKHGAIHNDMPDRSLFAEEPEIALGAAMDHVAIQSGAAIAKEEFHAGLASIATLRKAIDRFFDAVMVNVDDEAIRINRLRLLNRIREVTVAIADFAKIEG
ncbi:MAG: glycine--tRNA ligase subunit beta [Hyphomicrobiales bacterium]